MLAETKHSLCSSRYEQARSKEYCTIGGFRRSDGRCLSQCLPLCISRHRSTSVAGKKGRNGTQCESIQTRGLVWIPVAYPSVWGDFNILSILHIGYRMAAEGRDEMSLTPWWKIMCVMLSASVEASFRMGCALFYRDYSVWVTTMNYVLSPWELLYVLRTLLDTNSRIGRVVIGRVLDEDRRSLIVFRQQSTYVASTEPWWYSKR